MMERTPPRELIDLLALARRLDIVQAQPPAPLPHLAARQRDGPHRCPEPIARKASHHAAPSDPPAHSWDWRSKGT